MLSWCAYCQEFQGEVAPLDTFSITHGLCPACKAKGRERLDAEIPNSIHFRDIQDQLRDAGETGDIASASPIVQYALASGLRPVDVLLGLVTPLLYAVGEQWERGIISVSDQHRFSAFCERVFELIKLELRIAGLPQPTTGNAPVFLANARGNNHTLGIRILSLWLQSQGIETRELDPPPSPAILLKLVAEAQPRAILLSVSLDRQKAYVYGIAQRLEALPFPKPHIIVGGYAIKKHLIPPIPGVLFLETMTGLNDLISSTKNDR